jgi:small-conductance mechanosensitive channel
MTYEQIVANVERLRKLVSEARNRLNAELQLLAQWEAARNTDLANGASPVTIQNTVNRLAQVQANVARYREELATLESDLAKAVQLRDQVDAAMAKLIGEGVPPQAVWRRSTRSWSCWLWWPLPWPSAGAW